MESVTIQDQALENDGEATAVPEENVVQDDADNIERPAWLPNKFESSEDLAKAYGQLEKKMSSRQAEEQGLLTSEDFQEYSAQYLEKGGLDDKTYGDLGKRGLSRELVDQYIEGQQLLANRQVQELQDVTGGEENYTAMLQWASETLGQDDLDAFNAAVQGDPSVAKLAIRGLYAQFGQEGSTSTPRLVQGGKAGNLGGYGSTYEMQQDMKNPLYQAGDTTFHAMVDRRLAATSGSVI